MTINEKELEIYLINLLKNGDYDSLKIRGLDLLSFNTINKVKWVSQLNLDPYGIADIVGFYRGGYGVICVELIELKAIPIKTDHFDQICTYSQALKVYLKNTFNNDLFVDVKMTLIGQGYQDGHYIQNHLQCDVVEYSIDLFDGIKFNQHPPQWHRPDGDNKSFRKFKKTYGSLQEN